jgi:hypothetical protein
MSPSAPTLPQTLISARRCDEKGAPTAFRLLIHIAPIATASDLVVPAAVDAIVFVGEGEGKEGGKGEDGKEEPHFFVIVKWFGD